MKPMKLLIFLLLSIGILYAPSPSLAQSCSSFFSTPPPLLPRKFVLSEEEQFYLPDSQKQDSELVFKNLKVYYKNSPHNEILRIDPNLKIDSPNDFDNFSIVVVDREKRFLGSTKFSAGSFHHSTLASGREVYFAGVIETNAQGRLLTISNHSGHYQPPPFYIKWFIDFLGGPKALPGVRILLPLGEVSMSSADFYKSTRNQNDTETLILIRYLTQILPEKKINTIPFPQDLIPAIFRLFHMNLWFDKIQFLPEFQDGVLTNQNVIDSALSLFERLLNYDPVTYRPVIQSTLDQFQEFRFPQKLDYRSFMGLLQFKSRTDILLQQANLDN